MRNVLFSARLPVVVPIGDRYSVPGDRHTATPEEQSALARMLVVDMLVDDRQIVALRPVDIWAPIFSVAFSPDDAHPGYLRCGAE